MSRLPEATISHITFADRDRTKAKGRIATMWLDLEFVAYPNPDAANNERAPAYRVYGRSPAGALVDIGGIWERTNDDSGRISLSIQINDTGVKDRTFSGYMNRMPGGPEEDDTLWIMERKDDVRRAATPQRRERDADDRASSYRNGAQDDTGGAQREF